MLLGELMDALVDFFYSVLYKCFAGICVIIDFIKTIFYKLCGIETVSINGEETDLLSTLMGSNDIKRTFLIITIIGAILLVVFTIIAIIKSCYQEKQNWKTVLTKNMHSFIIMLLIPFTVLAGIMLTNVIMTSINQAMQGNLDGSNGMIGGQFLITIGSDAYKGSISDRSIVESMFVTGKLDYNNLSTVKQYYDITNCNYVIGILGSLVMLVMFVLSSLTFVQRIFDIVLLYLISPISISTIPLDEGNRFRVWKDMLISKIVSAYGVILVMNLFFLIIPIVYQIDFFGNNFQNGIVYILFLIGGSFAVTKASRLISQLTGGQQSGGELAQMLYNVRSAFAFTKAAKAMVGGATMGLLAGSDYKKNRTKGKMDKGEAMKASIHSTRNQRVVADGVKKSKAKQVLGMPLRMATMPFGMLHDLSKGGLIQVGKNFMPRLKNALGGSSWVNHAYVKSKLKKKDNSKEVSKNVDSKANIKEKGEETKAENSSNQNTESTRENESIKENDNKSETSNKESNEGGDAKQETKENISNMASERDDKPLEKGEDKIEDNSKDKQG